FFRVELIYDARPAGIWRNLLDIAYRGRQLVQRIDQNPRLTIRYNLEEGASPKSKNRRTASHGFHRNQRTGFFNRAGEQECARTGKQFQFLLSRWCVYES